MVTVPLTAPKYTTLKDTLEQYEAEVAYNQSAYNFNTCGVQESAVQQVIPAQQPVQNPAPVNVNPIYNQGNNVPVNQVNSQPIPVPVNVVQAPPQSPIQAPAVQISAVPTSSPIYTMEQLAVAATQLVDAGRRSELVNLLQTFGVQALTALPKEQYGAFATQLRTLGVKI